jgi:ADP-L-glycero-D-manno-heptose 6-epimerase
MRLFASDRPDIGHGEQRRDFIWVGDAVDVILWLLETPDVNGLFNLGSGKARSWNDLAQAVATACGRQRFIEYVPPPAQVRGHYQYFTEAPMDRLRAEGYERPFTSLEDGVRRYVQDFLLAQDPYA